MRGWGWVVVCGVVVVGLAAGCSGDEGSSTGDTSTSTDGTSTSTDGTSTSTDGTSTSTDGTSTSTDGTSTSTDGTSTSTEDSSTSTEDSSTSTDVADADTSGPEPIWDLAKIRDASTAACTFTDARSAFKDGVTLDVWSVSYTSWESIDGALTPITIRGYAARPALATGALPGIVQAHGLGGHAEESHATGLAALTGAFVIAYTGPGGGSVPANTSEGRPAGFDDGRRMFDTVPDPRGAWFWGHAVAAMRALTCLEARDDVDAARLGMTGFSAGAVATLTVAGVDHRLVAAVPLSGTLAWDVATESPTAWQHELLRLAGLDTTSERWLTLMDLLDPVALLGGTSTNILMVNGTTDEFFPVSAHVATFDAIGSATRRTSLAANFDHGCYSLTGIESAATIEARADLRARGGQRMWFAHHFGTDPRFASLPDGPTAVLVAVGAVTAVSAVVDEDAGDLEVEEVRLWWSGDDALVWGSNALERQGAGAWGAIVPLTLTAGLLAYVDVTYTTGEIVGAHHFSLSSVPALPEGHVPRIRAINTCLAP
ncbi:MAG: acetylxylan esterase [Deltaproteobacteria bacterium]|nr:acetylxylan esterase [Deltaproteobacteria bacterium]